MLRKKLKIQSSTTTKKSNSFAWIGILMVWACVYPYLYEFSKRPDCNALRIAGLQSNIAYR